MDEKKLNKFLKELSELSQKYGIYISGCGCCGSPFLEELDENEVAKYFDNDDSRELKWFNPLKCYIYKDQ